VGSNPTGGVPLRPGLNCGNALRPVVVQVDHFAFGTRLSKPEAELRELLTGLIEAGELRDVPPTELALYCLNAGADARDAESQAAVRRMFDVMMTGLVKTAPD
jgi:hypothetical protein